MKCDRCLDLNAVIGKLCGPCYKSNVEHARKLQQRAQVKDAFGAIRQGEGKGIHKAELPLGAIVVRLKNGAPARFVKIKMGGVSSGRRWIGYGKWWWQENKGPVPPGMLVLHKDLDPMNDDPHNFMLGTNGTKLTLRHRLDPEWSKSQHQHAGKAVGEWNRKQGRINRAENFLKTYWYPVVDEMGVILNVPFRKMKRLLVCFGADVASYPKSGGGKKPSSAVQRAIQTCPARPVKSEELSKGRYRNYCLVDPVSKLFRGPLGHTASQVISQLGRMKIWEPAEKYAKKDLKDR